MVGAHQYIPFHNEIDGITQGYTGVDVLLNHTVIAEWRVIEREAIVFIQQMREQQLPDLHGRRAWLSHPWLG
ncbi:conserved hypothetical protein [Xenorhabdus nematophila F1]|nr:conserved hypothetical protein [Xenorhabdus nematophila F1]CEE91193.1 conserved hypothetical protein [Xenorhabdus nematophila str. Anatoliense]